MNRMLLGLIGAGIGGVAGLVSAPAVAGVIVDYNLTNIVTSSTSPAVTAPATTVAAGITATDITRGPGLTPINLARGFSSQGWNNSGTTSTTRADAIAGNKYYTFAVSIAPGSTASFSDITVGLYKSAQSSPANLEWQYSLDGFTTAGNTLVTFNHFGRNSGTAPGTVTPFQWMSPPYNNGGGPVAIDTPGQSNGNSTGALDISGITALQNLAGPATVNFRLYGWGAISGTTASTNTLALGRDIGPLINGTITPVPEPGGIALAVAGAGLAIACRLRRRRA